MNPFDVYPIYVIVLDYLLGMVMWTLIGRWVLDLFIARDNNMVIAKVFRQLTDPLIKAFKKITPEFLHPMLIPLYVAWWFYFIRFYLIPFVFVGEFGMLSFSLENFLFGNL